MIELNELENIELQGDISSNIEKIISGIKFLNESQKEKFSKKILNNIKVKTLQEK